MTTKFLELAENKLRSRDIKEITIKGYMNSLRNIRSGVKSTSKGLKFFKRTEKIITYMDSIDNIQSRMNLMKPILNLLKDEPKLQDTYQIYLLKLREYKEIHMNKQKENKFTDKEIKNISKWKDIKNIKPSSLDEKVFHSLLVNDNLFLRLEYFSIKLENFNRDTDNWIDGDNLVMNNFKNVKSLGPQKFKLSQKTTDIIDDIRGDWLMTNHNMSQPNRTRWIKNFFKRNTGKDINNNLLRKIFVNEVLKKNLSTNQLEKIARKMLNTFATWNDNYRKVN